MHYTVHYIKEVINLGVGRYAQLKWPARDWSNAAKFSYEPLVDSTTLNIALRLSVPTHFLMLCSLQMENGDRVINGNLYRFITIRYIYCIGCKTDGNRSGHWT